jgi:hypothetical protein
MHHIHREILHRGKQLPKTKRFFEREDKVNIYLWKPVFRGSTAPSTGQIQDSQVQQNLRRSTRQNNPIQRLIEAMQAELQDKPIPGELFSFHAMFPEEQVNSLLDVDPLLAFLASNDPDVIYLHEAMRQPDRQQFLKAMQQEVEGQTKNGIRSIIPRTEVPQGPPYFQQYEQCEGKEELIPGRSTNGKPDSLLTDQHKPRVSITGKRTHRWQHGHSSDSSWGQNRLVDLSLPGLPSFHSQLTTPIRIYRRCRPCRRYL